MHKYEYLIYRLNAYADKHETPPYGRAIEGEEELERAAADAIKNLIEENKKVKASCEIKTPLGELFAEPSCDMEYPGIWISLRRDDVDKTLALIECDKSGNPRIFTYVWGNEQDDYTHKIAHNGIEEYFKEMEGKK